MSAAADFAGLRTKQLVLIRAQPMAHEATLEVVILVGRSGARVLSRTRLQGFLLSWLGGWKFVPLVKL